jgi:hypothetical protein
MAHPQYLQQMAIADNTLIIISSLLASWGHHTT